MNGYTIDLTPIIELIASVLMMIMQTGRAVQVASVRKRIYPGAVSGRMGGV